MRSDVGICPHVPWPRAAIFSPECNGIDHWALPSRATPSE
jgi:hypothetical protein